VVRGERKFEIAAALHQIERRAISWSGACLISRVSPRFLVLGLSVIVLTSAAGQRLGETKKAIVAQRGAATEENHAKNTAVYRNGPLKFEVEYRRNIAQRVIVTALDYLSEDTIRGILALNAGDGVWIEAQGGGPTRVWQRTDLAQAQCDRSKPRSITLSNPGLKAPPPAAKPGFPFVLTFAVLAIVVGGLVVLRIVRKRRRSAPEEIPEPIEPEVTIQPIVPAPVFDADAPTIDTIRWETFELLVAEIFRRKGYAVEITSGVSADGGKDVVLRKEDEFEIVRCRNIARGNSVTAEQVRDFCALITAEGAHGGHFITTGCFSAEAKSFSARKPIELSERADIERMISEVSATGENLCDVRTWINTFAAHARVVDPLCPFCERPMKLRRETPGRSFWGCARHGTHRCEGKRDGREELLRIREWQPGESAH
jgi:hypothetical protein